LREAQLQHGAGSETGQTVDALLGARTVHEPVGPTLPESDPGLEGGADALVAGQGGQFVDPCGQVTEQPAGGAEAAAKEPVPCRSAEERPPRLRRRRRCRVGRCRAGLRVTSSTVRSARGLSSLRTCA
jgi:hypothetical protein